MRVVVTGATGFIGHAIAREGKSRGFDVVALHRSGPPADAAGVTWLTFDDWDRSKDRADVVVHAAAIRHRHGVSPEEYGPINVSLTDRVLARAAKDGARFVLVSSVAVYGKPPKLPIDESCLYAPTGPYGVSKVETEERVTRSGLPFTVVQPSITYGPGDTNGMIDKMTRMIARGFFVVPGLGRARTQLVYVEDLARITIDAALSERTLGQRFIATSDEPIRVGELVRLIAKAVGTRIVPVGPPTALLKLAGWGFEELEKRGMFKGGEPPVTREKLATITTDYAYRTDRMHELLGRQTMVAYEDGILRTARALGLARR